MKRALLILAILAGGLSLQAQDCSQIFISEYIEGWSNNKALELYNPTDAAIDLSNYEVARYQNGEDQPGNWTQLSGTIDPYGTFVVGLDKRDPDGVDFEQPLWDDLMEQVDLFINPQYNNGLEAMYFNGNDVLLIRIVGGAPVDIFGKPGQDPATDIPGYSDPDISGQGWPDENLVDWTKDHTLIRKPTVLKGVTAPPAVFNPSVEYDSLSVNTFTNLGMHECDCASVSVENAIAWEDIQIYPSFMNANASVQINSMYAIESLRFMELSGKEVVANEVNLSAEGASFVAGNWDAGFYLVDILLKDGQRISRKIVVQ